MSTNVTLPALGESVSEGTVSRWLKQVGDTVEVDEALVEISTDKVDTEIPSPVAGTVLEIKVEADETAAVGAVLAVIGEAGESAGGSDAAPAEQDAVDASDAEAASVPQPDAETPQEQATTQQETAPQESAPAAASAPAADTEGTEVTLPALGESVSEGTVSRWLKQVGEQVEADEALVEISTDKVDTEIPSPVSGTLLEIKVAEDQTAPVGAVLAIVGEAGSAAPAGGDTGNDAQQQSGGAQEPSGPDAQAGATPPSPEPEPEGKPLEAEVPSTEAPASAEEPAPADQKQEGEKQPATQEPAQQAPAAQPAPAQPAPKAQPAGASESQANAVAPRRGGEEGDSYVTPLVRKLAAQNGVDLASITGTGVGGRIRKQDVLDAAEAAKKAAAAPAAQAGAAPQAASAATADASSVRGTSEKISRLRSTIARRMVESLQVSAQLTATVEVDLTLISRLRAKVKDDFKKREGASLSYLPFITKAAIEALKQFPKVNATIDTEAGTITYPDGEHIGIAVDTEKGLLVPVIKDAGDLNVAGLAKKIGDLASRTRSNKVTPDELTGGTFTITNYGSAGTLFDTPIVNQPQVAILGTGALVKRPVVLEDEQLGEIIAVRDMMYLSMSYDHRLVDGADAARFLSAVKARLEGGDFGAELGL